MRSTDKIELVETQVLALSFSRLYDGSKNGYSYERWKRALYHALGMSEVASNSQLEAIRKALDLP